MSRTLDFTYFLQCQETGRIKIGITNNPEKRLRLIRSLSPTTVKAIGLKRGGNQVREHQIHDALDDYRHHGEWFEPNGEVLQFIEYAIETFPPENGGSEYRYEFFPAHLWGDFPR